jgi:hypothetical protein
VTGISVHHNGQHSTLTADIGRVCRIQLHRGVADHVAYVDLHCSYGRLSMTAADLIAIIRSGQEALAAKGRGFPDCSGSLTHIEETP